MIGKYWKGLSMTRNLKIKRIAIFGWCLWVLALSFHAFADNNALQGFTEKKLGADVVAYDTELFNLLSNEKNIIDNKNYYLKDFAIPFDTLLRQSQAAQTQKDAVFLKKRLLSGPASKPRAIKDGATNKMYIYYNACQAHACDTTKLGLLYEVGVRQMVAKLTVQGKAEFLGEVTPAEKDLLSYLQSENARRLPNEK